MNRRSDSTRVLVVEDDAIVSLGIRMLLGELGYEVCGLAASAPEAVREAEKLSPDLALMDINLADGTDGIEAARELRRRFDIPSVFLSAYADPGTRERAEAARPLGFVPKPYSIRKLDAVLRQATRALREARRTG